MESLLKLYGSDIYD